MSSGGNMIGVLKSKHNRQMLIKRKNEVIFAYLFLAVMIIFAVLTADRFVTMRNLRNLLSANIGLLLVSYGQLCCVLLGGVDLSTGSVISLTNVICVTLITDSPSTWVLAGILSLAVGAGIGFVNGLLVTKGNLQPLIATLATQTFFAGVALLIMPNPTGTLPSKLCKFISKGCNYLIPVLIVLVTTVIMWIVINRRKFGRALLAIGGNEQSARSSGIHVDRVKIKAFMLCGFMAALAGLYISAFTTSGSPIVGDAYTQKSINAAVVGGAALAGGKGSVIGCIAATLILGIISNLLNLKGVSSYYQYVFQGLILIIALSVSAIRSKR
ncbi:ABC transporter permease [Oscillospiraceae bacterium NTUH-002-81]|nr:ABC transporter permease [Oscillospiraceae bacterium NTUH-002-81]